MDRRNFLTAAPAAGMAAMLMGAVPVQASTETPIMAMFRQWQHFWDKSIDEAFSDEDRDAAVDEFCKISDDIWEMPIQSPQDWIAKAISYTSYGDFALKDQTRGPAFWADAREMIAL